MGTSLRGTGTVGTAALTGPAVTPGDREPHTFWSRFGWLLAAAWTVFLIFPILTIAESALPMPARVAGYGLIAAFAVVYLWSFYIFGSQLGVSATGQARAWFPFTALLLIVVASAPLLGADAISFGPFLISFAAYLLSVRSMWITNIVILGVSVTIAVGAGLAGYVFLLGLLVVLIVVNAVNTTLIRKSMATADLRVENLMLTEQERMARDVHDALGHSLTAVGLKAQLAERLLDTDIEAARSELKQINALTVEALDSIRATVGGLRRTTLAEELTLVRVALDDAGVRTVLIGDVQENDPVRSTALAWILREAVTNVLRHAHATTCWIRSGDAALSIEDDGDSLAGAREGHGMRGMRERARLHGARCEMGPSEHGGTKVEISW